MCLTFGEGGGPRESETCLTFGQIFYFRRPLISIINVICYVVSPVMSLLVWPVPWWV